MKIDIKNLKKISKAVNNLNIAEDKIEIIDDIEEMINQYLIAIMRISDKGKEDSLTEEMVELYNQCCEYHDSKSNETVTDDPAEDEFDRDKLETELEDMDFEETEIFIQENDLEIDIDENTFDENQDELVILILDKMEEKSKPMEGVAVSMKSKIEKELSQMSFKEMKAYVKIDPELNEIKFSKKEFEEDKKSIIDKILEIKIKPEEDSDNLELSTSLAEMSYKEIKAFIKEKAIDIEFKIKDWKTDKTRSEIIEKVIAAISPTDNKPEEKFDREKIEEKLSEMDFDEFEEFVEENNLAHEISDLEEETFDKDQEDLIEEVLDVLEERAAEQQEQQPEEKENPLAKELRSMDFKAFKDYVKSVGMAGDIKLKKSSFENDKDDLISQILEKALTKKEEPKTEKAKADKKEPKITPPKKSLRKEGNTVQEIIARVIKEAKKPLTKDEIIKIVVEKRGGDDVEKTTKSTANFLNIVIQACLEMGVMIFDEKKNTYSIKK